MLTILITLLLNTSTYADVGYDPTDDLMSAFGPSCSVGRYTNQALGQSASLQKVLANLEQDAACHAIQGALTNFVSGAQQMRLLLEQSKTSFNGKQIEAHLNDLLSAYLNEKDPALKAALEQVLAQYKIDSILQGGEIRAEERKLFYQGIENFVQYSKDLFGALNQSGMCLKSGGAFAQVLGQIISQASYFVSYPVGPISYMVGQTINELVQHLRTKKYQKQWKQLSMARASVAVGCALESMSATYCQARDAQVLIEENAKSFDDWSSSQEKWSGLTLITRDIDTFTVGMQRIVAGAPASNMAAAHTKEYGHLLEASLRVAEDRMTAALKRAQERVKLLNTQSADYKTHYEGILRSTINALTDAMINRALMFGNGNFSISSNGGINTDSPFYEIFLIDTKCGAEHYFYTGKIEEAIDRNNGAGACKAHPNVPTFENLKEYVQNIIKRANVSVTAQVKIDRENDYTSVLAELEINGPNLNNFVMTIDKIRKYLSYIKRNYSAEMTSFINDLAIDTDLILSEATIIMGSNINREDKVVQLQERLAPKLDPYFVSKRLRSLVNWDLAQKVKQGFLNSDLQAIMKLSTYDNVDSLARFNLVDLDRVNNVDAPESQRLIKESLKSFEKIFGDVIMKNINELSKQTREKSNDGVSNKSLDLACMRALVLPSIPNRDDYSKACDGRKMMSVYKTSQIEITVNKSLKSLETERMCNFFDFQRKSYLFGLTR